MPGLKIFSPSYTIVLLLLTEIIGIFKVQNFTNILTAKDTPNLYFLMTEVPLSKNSKDFEGNLSYASIRLPLIVCAILSYLYF